MAPTPGKSPALNQTTIAILGSLMIALVFATILTGNPFRATRLAYTDYSRTIGATSQRAPAAPPAVPAPAKP